MADGSIVAGANASGKTLSRTDGATTRSRADALRQISSPGSNGLAFAGSVSSTANIEPANEHVPTAEPGKGMLSTSIQLILAETRTQEGQSTYTDKPTLDKALVRYNESQTSVRETMSLTVLSSRANDRRVDETTA